MSPETLSAAQRRATKTQPGTKVKTINLETQRKRRKQRFLGGITANSAVISQACEKAWFNVTTPKKPLLPLLPLRFKVLVLVLVAAPSRCVSRFMVLLSG